MKKIIFILNGVSTIWGKNNRYPHRYKKLLELNFKNSTKHWYIIIIYSRDSLSHMLKIILKEENIHDHL